MIERDAQPETISIAIETSGPEGSVAIGVDGQLVRAEEFSTTLNHAVELLPAIDRLCSRNGVESDRINDLYVSGGPGSFTGLRIGITAARTLAWSIGANVVRVPTLEVIAQNAMILDNPPPVVAVVLDAKRKKVYAAAFERCEHTYQPMSEPAERDAGEFFAELPPSAGLMGGGLPYVAEQAHASGLWLLPPHSYRPRAEIVHQLAWPRATRGEYDSPSTLIPIYVRRPEAEEVWERRQGQPHQ